MMLFKGCPRCGGDLMLREDEVGPFIDCVQCGFVRYGEPKRIYKQCLSDYIPERVA